MPRLAGRLLTSNVRDYHTPAGLDLLRCGMYSLTLTDDWVAQAIREKVTKIEGLPPIECVRYDGMSWVVTFLPDKEGTPDVR